MAEGKSVQQTVDMLHKKLEQLGAIKHGSFWVDCETYHATGNTSGNYKLLELKEVPVEPTFIPLLILVKYSVPPGLCDLVICTSKK